MASCAGGGSTCSASSCERFGVAYHERTVGKLLQELGFSHISARPRHPAQDAQIDRGVQKQLPRHAERASRPLPKRKPVEIWFQML